jgi:hypothetical protein
MELLLGIIAADDDDVRREELRPAWCAARLDKAAKYFIKYLVVTVLPAPLSPDTRML